MSLLPSRGPETSTRQEGEFEVVGVDEDVAPVLDALASDTAREVLNAIYEDPGTPSEIAGRLDMSIQKVAYHLEKLEDVDLIAAAGTRYSEKGQEMTVYEPPDDPLVLFVGTEERKSRLRSLVRRVVPTVGALGFGSLLVQRLFDSDVAPAPNTGDPTTGGGDGLSTNDVNDVPVGTEGADTATPATTDGGQVGIQATSGTEVPSATGTPAPSATAQSTADTVTATTDAGGNLTSDQVAEVAAQAADPGIEPGLAFFLGGIFVLAIVGAWWYYRSDGH